MVQPAPIASPGGSVQLSDPGSDDTCPVRAGPAAGTAIGLALGVLLPTVPCRSVIARDRAALWLGPDEWLILAPETASDLPAQAVRAAGDHPVSIVDVSHRSQTLEITGPRAAWCLNAFCALDLDLRAFPVGMCTRTLLGKAEVVLWRIAPEVFHLDVARSFVPYVWALSGGGAAGIHRDRRWVGRIKINPVLIREASCMKVERLNFSAGARSLFRAACDVTIAPRRAVLSPIEK